jgi:ATP-binding cassette subfamily B protein
MKTFVRQQGQSDCGVACLLSIIRYYGGNANLETLRIESGTDKQGTTLLGLMQGAEKQGFEAEAFEADNIDVLKEIKAPAILQVLIDGRLEHYVVFYPAPPLTPPQKRRGGYIIGDPAKGIIELNESELAQIWQSKKLLLLEPNERFIKANEENKQKQKWLFRLIQEDTNILIVSVLLGLILAVLGLVTAIFSQQLIDKILPAQDTQKLVIGLILLTLVLLARSGLNFLRGFMLISQSKDFNVRLLNDFIANLLYLPKTFFDSRKTGELIARMNDSKRIQSVISFLTGSFATDLLVVLVSTIFIFTYSSLIGAVVLVSIPLYSLLVWYFNQPIIRQQQAVMQNYAYNESHYINTLQGIDALKTKSKEPFFIGLSQQIFSSLQEKIFQLGKIGLHYAWFSELISLILTVLVIAFASFLVVEKTLQIGEMVAILSMSGSIFSSVNRLAMTNIQIREAQVALDRLFEFTKIKKEFQLETQTNPIQVSNSDSKFTRFLHLKAQNLKFRFAGRKPLFTDFSFEVKTGEMIAITGENGVGKSILLQILQKFYACEAGEITINEENLEAIDTKSWRSQLGVVPQEISLFNGNLLYNIVLEEITQEKAIEVINFCKQIGIHALFEQFPQGYFTLLGESGIHLSGGQKQLVGLARALFHQPQLLLLDEATSAMDRKTKQFVMNLLEKLKTQIAIIFITHQSQEIQQADKVYHLEDRKLSLA